MRETDDIAKAKYVFCLSSANESLSPANSVQLARSTCKYHFKAKLTSSAQAKCFCSLYTVDYTLCYRFDLSNTIWRYPKIDCLSNGSFRTSIRFLTILLVFVISLKVCLHVRTPSPAQYPSTFSIKVCSHVTSPSKFNIVPMVMGTLMGRLGVLPIQPVTHTHNVKLWWWPAWRRWSYV